MKKTLLTIACALLANMSFAAEAITEQPEGTAVNYNVTGNCVLNLGFLAMDSPLEGTATFVFDADGKTVYIQNPVFALASLGVSSWVKGTIEGNAITVAPGQSLGADDGGDMICGIILNVVNESISGTPDAEASITYTMSADRKTISLDCTDKTKTIGIIQNGVWKASAEYGTVYTTTEEVPTGISTAGIETQVSATYTSLSGKTVGQPAKGGVYIKTVTMSDGTKKSTKVVMK